MLVPALAISLLLHAAPSKPPRSNHSAQVERARALFRTAQRLYREARYADAIARFEEVYTLKPSPSVLFNIGRCHEQLGDVPRALRAYRDYLRLSPEAKDRDTVGDAIANLERRLREQGVQQLLVFADPPTATIEVDGKQLGTPPASIELTAGNHKVVVRAPGHETVERSFVMQVQRATELTVNLRRAEEPPPASAVPMVEAAAPPPAAAEAPTPGTAPPPAVSRTAPSATLRSRAWIPLIGAGVGVAAGAVGFIQTFTLRDALVAELRGSGTVSPRAQELAAQGSAFQIMAWAGVGVTVASLATAALLFFLPGAPAAPVVAVEPSGVRLGLVGVFP